MRFVSRRRRIGGEQGAAAVEFALVLPIFLVLIFGVVQYAWYFYQTQETAFALREGARVAAVGTQSAEGICELVGGKMPTGSEATVTVSATGVVGDQITVNVKRSATDFGLPFIPFPSSIQQIDQDGLTRTENVQEDTKGTYDGTSWVYTRSTNSCA